MFTGIIQKVGRVVALEKQAGGHTLAIAANLSGWTLAAGESIAVQGACLTLTGWTADLLRFDLLDETLQRTALRQRGPGEGVNLERALRVGGSLGGHFVTGHVDGTGVVRRWEASGRDYVLEVDAPKDLRRYLVPKGSVAVDGISLTVADVLPRGFRIWIIPHTREVTSLGERNVGDRVNLEADMLGKYVERFVSARAARTGRARKDR